MTRPPRPCRSQGCPYPALKGRQLCGWHWLARQPADVQSRAAASRLARTPPEQHRARIPSREWPAGARWCAGCQSFVPLFYTRSSRCIACASSAAHSASIEKTFGISAERYDELLAIQGGRCAICRQRPRSKRLAVDHDHQTGVVRGLLCKRCNRDLLGSAHDDVKILLQAVAYMEAPPATGEWQAPERPRNDDPPF